MLYYAERAVLKNCQFRHFLQKKSPSGASSALTSVAVVVKPWFEAEKMLFSYEINNFSETGVFLN